jgi:hypothetical protein
MCSVQKWLKVGGAHYKVKRGDVCGDLTQIPNTSQPKIMGSSGMCGDQLGF